MTRVLIADDERLFAAALELILGSDERIEVVGTAFDGKQAVELTLDLAPDVVLMDLSMPGLDGFAAIEAILSEASPPRVLVLTGSADPADIARARTVGVHGYLTKENIAGDLVERVLEAAT